MTSPAIATHEQTGLVGLSVVVAIVAGYLALDLAQRNRTATTPADVPARLHYS